MLAIVAIPAFILNAQVTNPLRSQPTFKLDVKPDLKPLATIKLDGAKVSRSELADDPGFRLQYHVRAAEGKTLQTAEARSAPSLELPLQTAGTFTIVLELFHPAYKGGNDQKGAFKPVSNVLTFKVEAGKLTQIETPPPKKAEEPPAKKP